MLTIQSLTGHHNRKAFDCGKPALDEWLAKSARQHQDKGISQTFVAVDAQSPATIHGFYALSACEVVTENLPSTIASRLPRNAPGIRLGRLAVNRSDQKTGLEKLLLVDAIKRSCEVRGNIGVFALFVDAIDDEAIAFYGRFGFVSLPDSHRTMVLPLEGVCSDK